MRKLWTITKESFVLYRRDKIFFPILIGGSLILLGANIVSEWSIEDFTKIAMDIASFGYYMLGTFVAIFWGSRAMSSNSGIVHIELPLSAGVSRSLLIVGRYLGLALCLLMLGLLLMVIFYGFSLLSHFVTLNLNVMMILIMHTFSWLIIAAFSILYSTMSTPNIAIFASFSTWLIGVSSSMIANTLHPATPLAKKEMIQSVAKIFDLQRFNLTKFIVGDYFPSNQELTTHALYGGSLILAFLALSCLLYARKDIVN